MEKTDLYKGAIKDLEVDLRDFCVRNYGLIRPVRGHPEFTFILQDKHLAFYYYKFCENLSNSDSIEKVNKGLNFINQAELTTFISELKKRAETYDFDQDSIINPLDYGVMKYL